jgi:HPr kinase/phosphorylase
VDLVVTLKVWDHSMLIERVGIDDELTQILGIDVPHITIPVRPGRDLARLVEVAAFQTKLKTSGYNSAKELNDRLIHKMTTSGKLRN